VINKIHISKGKKKMKRILATVLAAVLALALVSCTANNEESGVNNAVYENVDTNVLSAIADSLYEGIAEDNRPFVMSMPLTEEDFEFFTFIPYEEGLEAVANEPMMGSIAHSIVLVKCPTPEKAAEVAQAMKDNCNPRKWVCVEADIVKSETNGNIAMLLMTTEQGGMADTISSNFASLNAEKIASIEVLPADDEGVFEEEVFEDEFFEDEVFTEDGDVVIELPEEDAGDAPAEMPGEDFVDAMPAV
jgi:hypothetical protein